MQFLRYAFDDMDCMRPTDMALLFYLVGPSGSGKDTLIDYCRTRLQPSGDIRIARRCITRPATAGGEAHIAVTDAEFEYRRAAGEFALHWQANGFRYGIGTEIDAWLNKGISVLVNGSRAHMSRARQRYGRLLVPIEVQVAPTVLRTRLAARGREDTATADARLQRSNRLQNRCGSSVLTIDNNGPIAEAGERLLAMLAAPSPMVGF